jgi:hypothetical protein
MKTNMYIEFDAEPIPGGPATILDQIQCGQDMVEIDDYTIGGARTINVMLTLDETDARVPQVLALLAMHGEKPVIWRKDIYTEDELQAARLLVVRINVADACLGGPRVGTTYDMSNACSHCGTGARQTSDMFIDYEDLKTIKKYKLASTYYNDLLLDDGMAEKLMAANPTGLSLRKVFARMKDGSHLELPRKQLIAEHVMPPLAPTSLLTRTGECHVCHRGGVTPTHMQPTRFVYRPQDLVGIQDVNLTWEWIGQIRPFEGDVSDALFPYPYNLVTPKVMNILRTEKGPQGAEFVPIWIDKSAA